MSALPVKSEVKLEPKYGASATQESRLDTLATQDTAGGAATVTGPEGKKGTVYTCGNCTSPLFFTPENRLTCPTCSHITGASSVFYKIRTEPTVYDTI